jgi:alkylation response protein AidB-like acyl-CoA dehydrogenase
MADALAKAGLLQMYLPRSMGGPELPPLVVFRVVEEFSRADGSIGWCTMIATAATTSISWLEPEVGRQMAGRLPIFGSQGRSGRRGARAASRVAIASRAVEISQAESATRLG